MSRHNRPPPSVDIDVVPVNRNLNRLLARVDDCRRANGTDRIIEKRRRPATSRRASRARPGPTRARSLPAARPSRRTPTRARGGRTARGRTTEPRGRKLVDDRAEHLEVQSENAPLGRHHGLEHRPLDRRLHLDERISKLAEIKNRRTPGRGRPRRNRVTPISRSRGAGRRLRRHRRQRRLAPLRRRLEAALERLPIQLALGDPERLGQRRVLFNKPGRQKADHLHLLAKRHQPPQRGKPARAN